jgi:hypothetical protein
MGVKGKFRFVPAQSMLFISGDGASKGVSIMADFSFVG